MVTFPLNTKINLQFDKHLSIIMALMLYKIFLNYYEFIKLIYEDLHKFRSYLLFLWCLFFTSVKSQEKQEDKINAATSVLKDFGKMKESIPGELLKVTEGIIVVPKLINAGFVVAGKRGKGVAMVKLDDGTWSNPVFVTITGGSVGFQAGVQAVDLVLIFKSQETLEEIGKGSFTLGGDISVTAGPVGRIQLPVPIINWKLKCIPIQEAKDCSRDQS